MIILGESFHEAFKSLVRELGVSDLQGYQTSEVDKNALRLNVKLPKPLRDFYLDLAATPSVRNAFQNILPPSGWEIVEDRVIFARENQDVVFWGLGKEQLSEESDPIVDIANNCEPLEWFKEDLPISRFAPFLFLVNMTEGSFDYIYDTMLSETQLDSLRAKSRLDLFDNGMRITVIDFIMLVTMGPIDDKVYQSRFYSNKPIEVAKVIE